MSMTITKSTLTLPDPKPMENPFALGRLVVNKGEGPKRVLLVTDPLGGGTEFKAVVVYTDIDPGWSQEVGARATYMKGSYEPFEGTVTLEQYRDAFMS